MHGPAEPPAELSTEAPLAAPPADGHLPDGNVADGHLPDGTVADGSGNVTERSVRRRDAGQLAVVTFSHAVQHVYVAGMAVAYPFVIASLHVSYGTLGIVLGIAGIAGGLLQGLAGFVSRVSSRMLLSVQNIGMAVASVLGGISPGFALFGAARCIGSVVSWPQHPVGSAVLAKRFAERRAYALSWHVAGGSIGTAVTPLAIAALIASYGWRVGVAFLAVPLTVGGVLVAWKLKSTGPEGGSGPEGDRDVMGAPGETVLAENAARQPKSGHLDVLRDILRSREAFGAMIAGTIAAGGRGLGTLAVFVPAYLKSGLHLHALTVGALFTALLVGSILGPVMAGYVADRVGRRRVLLVVYVVGAATIAAFVMVGSDLLALVGVGVIMGIFAYSESPLLQAVFADGLTGTSHQGAFGFYFAVSYGVGSLWTIALGEVIATVGFHWAFYVMAASFVAAAAVIVWARPRTP